MSYLKSKCPQPVLRYTHTHTHTHTHACMHAHTHAQAHTHIYVHTHTHTIYKGMHIHMSAWTYTHACIHTQTHLCSCAHENSAVKHVSANTETFDSSFHHLNSKMSTHPCTQEWHTMIKSSHYLHRELS